MIYMREGLLLSDPMFSVLSESIRNLKNLSKLELVFNECYNKDTMSEESVIHLGKMMLGLEMLEHLRLEVAEWGCITERSAMILVESVGTLKSLSSLSLNLSAYNH
jgi:hypothetical protein